MKIISGLWGEYMDYCAKNNLMPTDAGFEIWAKENRTLVVSPALKPRKECLPMADIRIRMLQNIRPDFPFGIVGLLGEKPGTILRAGMEYEAKSNKNGAICGLCNNGEWLGVKPSEFEFVEAPEWVLKIHGKEVGQ